MFRFSKIKVRLPGLPLFFDYDKLKPKRILEGFFEVSFNSYKKNIKKKTT